ncbi:hypothetical protein [Microbacterium esteraromaticum]|uniref:hypothetical protein n=1 Tax=Microbacterium esteraromaticum TaxID=57043 RepID=UPI0019572525|nr:hypothetical protein [Microbacterium esteraromaticum]MBM7465658.1 hypothetical protein [Microbacterium esteraromaticum]
MVRRLLPWAITIGLLVAAWLVAQATPGDDSAERAFVQQAEVGERVEGRDLAVTVQRVRAAEAITTPAGWRAEGTWVVVEMDAEAVLTEYGNLLSRTVLEVGDRVYSATERGEGESSIDDYMLSGEQLVPGIPKSGVLAFQLPDDESLTGAAMLELATDRFPVYDSIITVQIDLDALPVENSVELETVDWAGE